MRIRSVVAALFAAVLLSACVSVNLPPVSETPTSLSLSGKIVWRDLITDTPAASQQFYGELFGWEFEQVGRKYGLGDDINYSVIRHNGRLIGGMVNENKLQRTEEISQWIPLMSVSDIYAAVVTVQVNGGIVYTPPTELADRGGLAVIADPQGAILGLVQTKTGDPMDRTPRVGDFLWSEVWTNDVDAATNFYGTLGNYSAETEVLSDDATYRILGEKNKPRIGLVKNPVQELDPVWVTYIRVEDPAPILARVAELGGQVLLEARERGIGGEVALIADPSGAAIALQTWGPNRIIAPKEAAPNED